MKCPSNNMEVWVVMARVEEIHAQSADKVFNSKEKTHKYNRTRKGRAIR
jgi:hypothetical protein